MSLILIFISYHIISYIANLELLTVVHILIKYP